MKVLLTVLNFIWTHKFHLNRNNITFNLIQKFNINRVKSTYLTDELKERSQQQLFKVLNLFKRDNKFSVHKIRLGL